MQYNSVFGAYTIEKDTKGEDKFMGQIQVDNNDALTDFLSREVGLKREIENSRLQLSALSNPETYTNNRLAALENITGAIADDYRLTIQSALMAGDTNEQAQKKALDSAKRKYKTLREVVDEKYPALFSKQAKELLNKRFNIGTKGDGKVT